MKLYNAGCKFLSDTPFCNLAMHARFWCQSILPPRGIFVSWSQRSKDMASLPDLLHYDGNSATGVKSPGNAKWYISSCLPTNDKKKHVRWICSLRKRSMMATQQEYNDILKSSVRLKVSRWTWRE